MWTTTYGDLDLKKVDYSFSNELEDIEISFLSKYIFDDGFLGQATKLKKIKLAGVDCEDKLKKIPLEKFVQLEDLVLYMRPPSGPAQDFSCDHVFRATDSLRKLSLAGWGEKNISFKSFEKFNQLENLYINGANFNRIPKSAFYNNKLLKVLEISGKSLIEVDQDALEGLVNLEVLSLRSEKLEKISDSLISSASPIQIVYISGILSEMSSNVFDEIVGTVKEIYIRSSGLQRGVRKALKAKFGIKIEFSGSED